MLDAIALFLHNLTWSQVIPALGLALITSIVTSLFGYFVIGYVFRRLDRIRKEEEEKSAKERWKYLLQPLRKILISEIISGQQGILSVMKDKAAEGYSRVFTKLSKTNESLNPLIYNISRRLFDATRVLESTGEHVAFSDYLLSLYRFQKVLEDLAAIKPKRLTAQQCAQIRSALRDEVHQKYLAIARALPEGSLRDFALDGALKKEDFDALEKDFFELLSQAESADSGTNPQST